MGRKNRRKVVKRPTKKRKKAVKTNKKAKIKPFADGTMSSVGFFGMIRSALRKRTMYWKPIATCRNRARIPYIGPNKLRKWTYVCEGCKGHFMGTEVAVHHKIPAGTLTRFEDLADFVRNLFCDSDKLMLVCNISRNGKKSCHDVEHEKLENQKIIENYGKA